MSLYDAAGQTTAERSPNSQSVTFGYTYDPTEHQWIELSATALQPPGTSCIGNQNADNIRFSDGIFGNYNILVPRT